ncbi:carbohydrate-binding family 9-like protein [Ulvibacterium sp.]|uniref:carbohydrate-binding family 9-like protein n=1 Tax=Ulvibacterium sp. TaxID=2665914 RepID=UPI00345D29BD
MQRIKSVSFIFFLLYLGCIQLAAQEAPRKYVALKIVEPLSIDGRADETSWAMAEWSSDFIDIEGIARPKFKTKMKMLWDDTYLYFFAQMEEPHVWGTLKQRDTVIFYNNDFEIFIDPDGDTHNYMEFEMNALNTVWDLFLTKPYRNQGKVLDSWDIQGLKSAVHIDGTLNKSDDIDTGWNVEIAIPWSVLTEASDSKNPPENQFWRVNFSRVNWDYELEDGRYSRKKDENGKYLPEYNWVWSPQGVINMHEPEHWGYVYFSANNTGKDDFSIPKDDYIKWYLYELYRDFRNKNKNKTKGQSAKDGTFGESKQLLGSTFTPLLENCKAGFTIWAKSPFTNQTLMVRNDGKFETHGEK